MSSQYLQSPDRPYSNRRRGHVQQISISDANHHVTEAIGDMYGDSDWDKRDARPLSFAPSIHEASLERQSPRFQASTTTSGSESPLSKSLSNERYPANQKGSPPPQRRRESSIGSSNGQASPPSLTRSPSTDTANQAFPLNDIDYESSPAAVAQELSNLQAIRRMSMNVDAADPDLPGFNLGFGVPSVAPSSNADENDTSRLFWVPARLHPELAPKEFKTFVEDRVDRIKRRSRDDDALSPDSIDRHASSSAMNRRRSMLSRTIEMPQDLNDGADILERKRSGHQRQPSVETSLQELELLVNDPVRLVRKMSLDTSRRSLDSDAEVPASEDMPIMPTPAGQTLKRSTRTQYRRGSLRKEGRMRRTIERAPDGGEILGPSSYSAIPPVPELRTIPDSPEHGLSRVRTEPTHISPSDMSDSSSGPGVRQSPRQPSTYPPASLDEMQMEESSRQSMDSERSQPHPKAFQSRIARNGRTTAPLSVFPQPTPPVPQIIETPPPPEVRHSLPVSQNQAQNLPDRMSSHEFGRTNSLPSGGSSRSSNKGAFGKSKPQSQSLEDMANSPSAMPGTDTSTDALSFIPTFSEGKKPEKKQKGSKDSGESTGKKSWGWLSGREDKEKKKEEKEEKESSKKSKSKSSKSQDKSHDNTRLDVLQTTADGPRGRESLVLDRDSLRLEEERKKESSRRSGSGDAKKDKEPGIFSSLFGGKKKGDRESGTKKVHGIIRGLSPEPPRKMLRADIDYNWTRFSILEERAIYRMAHIKLANPRRALHSQVLLSNFMYSYLAKVQQMHPQIQIPQFAQQKNGKQRAQEQKQEQQPDEYSQWQQYQEEQQEHMGQDEDADDSRNPSSGTHYIDDYDPEHQQAEDARHAEAYGNGDEGYADHQQQYHDQDPYAQQGLFDDDRPPEDGEMW